MFKEKNGFGEIILSQLKNAGKSQKWLAEQCGISKGQINHIIHGKSSPSLKVLANILKTLPMDDKDVLSIFEISH